VSIPAALTELPQWVLWRYEDRGGLKPTKIPYSAHTGRPCDVKNPSSWSTFASVTAELANGYDGRGLALTKQLKLVAIDLDNPYAAEVNGELITIDDESDPSLKERALSIRKSHETIVTTLNSYTEWSPSNLGLRIFVWAYIPDGWRNRIGKVEIYDHDRYMTVTGLHLAGMPLTIEHRQAELELVMKSLGLHEANEGSTFESQPETRSDVEVYSAICNSKVGAAFLKLYNGDASGYTTGSEADLALANYIGFATDNKEQAERIFRASQHYANREKLHERPDLITRAINKSFDQKTLPLNPAILTRNAAALDRIEAEAPRVSPDPEGLSQIPDGMLGFLMFYILSAAPRPIPDFALAGAIGLMGGICGRSYNVEGLGLNQYVAVLGPSTVGKEAIGSGISKVLTEAQAIVPSARNFYGPGVISSAPALLKRFSPDTPGGNPSFVAFIGELGEWLLEHTSQRANDTKRGLIRALLQLYGLSSAGHESGAIAYSDSDKNVASVKSPSLSIIGETVAGSFFEACTARNIQSGFIPRFLIFNYEGLRPPLNVGHHLFKGPPQWIQQLADFCAYCHKINEAHTPVNVVFDTQGKAAFREYELFTDALVNKHLLNPAGAIWGRAYAKALKLAALYAVGENIYQPTITRKHADWGTALANRDVRLLVDKLNTGEVQNAQTTTGEDPRHSVIAHTFISYVSKPHSSLKGRLAAETSAEMHDGMKLIRYSRFRNQCLARAPFKRWPEATRNRDFDNTMKELKGVFLIGEAHTFTGGDASKLWTWNIKEPSTELIACVDPDAANALAKEEA
jgi:hypothetical protein